MPVHLEQLIETISEEKFHDLDFQVMKLAFEVHNQLGRFYDEKIYKNKLAAICRANGLTLETEVVLQLNHKTFSKNLYIDLLLERGAIYELKAANAIVSDHRIQTLDYLFLTNIKHGKIINFRPPSVTYEFVSTGLDLDKRRAFSIHPESWLHESEPAQHLKSTIFELFEDWGLFLNTALYKEAVCHLLGGAESVIRPVPIKSGGSLLGQQNIPLLSPAESFCISSVTENPSAYQMHLQRFLDCTELKNLHWINLCRSAVHFTSLRNANCLKLFCP
jgi:GxxExxY protein